MVSQLDVAKKGFEKQLKNRRPSSSVHFYYSPTLLTSNFLDNLETKSFIQDIFDWLMAFYIYESHSRFFIFILNGRLRFLLWISSLSLPNGSSTK